jgi:hypothetical protein
MYLPEGSGMWWSNHRELWLAEYELETDYIEWHKAAKKISRVFLRGITISLPQIKRSFIEDIRLRIEGISRDRKELPLMEDDVNFSKLLKIAEFFDKYNKVKLSQKLYNLNYIIASGRGSSVDAKGYQVTKNKVDNKIEHKLNDFSPSVTSKNLNSINLEKRIKNTKSIKDLLRIYSSYDRMLSKIETYTYQACVEWDRYIQLEIDIARGK